MLYRWPEAGATRRGNRRVNATLRQSRTHGTPGPPDMSHVRFVQLGHAVTPTTQRPQPVLPHYKSLAAFAFFPSRLLVPPSVIPVKRIPPPLEPH